MTTSSLDLHPEHGARFVATRTGEEDDPLGYCIEVFLPAGVRLTGELDWPEGRARLQADWDDTWATDEVLKLARVLKRTKRARVTRWRAREPDVDDSSRSA